MVLDEPRLVELAREGDPAAWTALYDQHYDAVFRYCYYRLGDAELAQDLAGDVFVRMVEKLDSFQHRGRPLLTWLYTIARNLIVDRHRQAGQAVLLPLDETVRLDRDGDSGPERAVERRLLADCLGRALEHLTEEQRQVVLIKFVEGYSNAQAARLMDKTEGSVKALQHRALVTLRRVLKKMGCDEG